MFLQILKNWAWLRRSQWLNKEQLMMIQTRKLKEIIGHAYENTSFYNSLYKKADVRPEVINSIQSIRKVPIITKEQIRNIPLQERTARGIDVNSCITKTTSGSTGIPVTILEDPYSTAYLEGLHLRRFWSYGARPWHRVVRMLVSPKDREIPQSPADKHGLWSLIRDRKLANHYLSVDIQQHIRFLSEWKPDIIVAPPSYFRVLVHNLNQQGLFLGLRLAISWGEILDDSTRRLIGNSFETEVFDGYGCTEVAPLGGLAWECPTHYGYHINMDSVVLEILRDGENVAPGESGTVCATSLFRRATPMIRYFLGDMVTSISDECPCGRGLPLLKNIQGRVVDFIVTKEGRYISPHAIMFTFQDVKGVAHYKVTQRSDYSVELLVKTSEDGQESVLATLGSLCKELFDSLQVDIQAVDRIEAIKGAKFRVVESHVPKTT